MKTKFPKFTLGRGLASDHLNWTGKIELYSTLYELHIEYPTMYPFVQPKLLVYRCENGEKTLERFPETTHRYQDGSICLYTWDKGPESWQLHYTVIDVLDKFFDFIDLYKQGTISPVHHSSQESPLPSINTGIIIPIKYMSHIRYQTKGLLIGKNFPPLKHNMTLINKIIIQNTRTHKKREKNLEPDDYFKNLQVRHSFPFPVPVRDIKIKWYFVKNDLFDKITYCRTTQEITDILTRQLPYWDKECNFQKSVVFITTPESKQKHHKSHCVVKLPNSEVLGKIRVVWGSWNEMYYKRLKRVLGGRKELFDDFVVVLVGLGSLGGEIAWHLVKSGVEHFILIDPDQLLPENLSRHVLGSEFLFEYKVQGLSVLLQGKNPSVKIIPINENIQHPAVIPSVLETAEKYGKKIVFVSTAADLEAEYLINAVSVFYQRPAIYASCSSTVQMGRVFRVIPYRTPCYHCIGRASENKEVEQFPERIDTWHKAPYEEGLPGIGIDISEIAVNAARLIIQTMLEESEQDRIYPKSQGDHHLIVLHKSKSLKPGKHVQKIKRLEDCPVCGSKDTNQDKLAEVNELLDRL
ncbi:MAG: ThiF family adenylyltransferase [Candidatus Odinarchaeota archaeon]